MDLGCFLALKKKEEDEEGFDKLSKEIQMAIEKYKNKYKIPQSVVDNFIMEVNNYTFK